MPENLQHFLFYVSPLRILDFIFRMFLYRIIRKKSLIISYNTGTYLEIFVLIVFSVWFAVLNIYSDFFRPYLYSILLWIPLALVIFTFYFEKGYISKKVLNRELFFKLGELSFSFYMLHHLVIRYFLKINKRLFNIDQGFVFYTFCFLCSLLAAYLSNRYFERHFYKKIAKPVAKPSS